MDFQGLPNNCRGFRTGREHVQNPKWSENPKQKPEPKHKIDDDVLGVGSCNIELLSVPSNRVAGLGRLSAGANMAMKPFVKCVITIFATNASFLRVISNFRI